MDPEDRVAQEKRSKDLWRTLDPAKQGQLNLDGLKRGLERLDHPLKDADPLLRDIFRKVDANGDGRVQYNEFHDFVCHAENELFRLFKSIDRDRNGQLDRAELKAALEASGISLPPSKFDQFFAEIDSNHDGVITFDEWRNFLLFLPADHPSLRTVVSYYTSTVTVNPEGDVHVSNETGEGLGNIPFLTALLGGFFRIFKTPSPRPPVPPTPTRPTITTSHHDPESTPRTRETSFPWDPGEEDEDVKEEERLVGESEISKHDHNILSRSAMLTGLLPDPGYFVAGGVAGAVSRTATAPLDRLKVYLIAQTSVQDKAVRAAKSGAPVEAAKTAARPLIDASKELWRVGGIRSLFAGNGLNVVKVMPESAIKFGSYEGSKRSFARLEGHDDPSHLHPVTQFFAAGMGGIISQFCIYPLDTLKFRLQCETIEGGPHGNALISITARKMWREGPRTFYRGLPMGLLGMFPYSAIDLTTFEYIKRLLTTRNAKRLRVSTDDHAAAPGNFATATIGAFSGAIGASAVYPLNLLRTRLQSQGTAIHPPTYTGMWDVTVKTVRNEGVRGLFRGITPNLLKVVPAVSITYVVYDNTKRLLGLR